MSTDQQPKDVDSNAYEINTQRFWQRAGLLHGHWLRHLDFASNKSTANRTNPYPGWNGSECILILCGKSDDAGYKRNNSIHIWLFGYELLSTIMIITRKEIYICAGSKTTQTLQQLVGSNSNESSPLGLRLITKNKSDGYEANFKELISILQRECKALRVGLIKEEMKGFAEKFQSHLESQTAAKFTICPFGEALSDVMMFKDKYETATIRKVSELTSLALKHFQKEMERVIEKGRSRTHSQLSSELLQILENPKMIKSNLKPENLDVCYDPIIQSGGKYKLKPSAECDADALHYEYGTIVIMMGFRLRDYCCNIARTFLIDASKQQKEIYNILVTVFKKGLLMLRDNTELHKVYEKCVQTIEKSKQPNLKQHFLKSCGWGIGLEFRDKNYIIKKNNKRQCKSGMIFNFQVGFENLVDADKQKRGLDKASKYSIIIADTVMVTDDQPEFLTKFNRKLLEYELNGDMDSGEKQKRSPKHNKEKDRDNDDGHGDSPNHNRNKKKSKDSRALDDAYLPAEDAPTRRVTRQSNRKSAQEQKQQLEQRKERAKKQDKLREERKRRLEELLSETGGNLVDEENENKWTDPEIFKESSDLPPTHKNGQNKLFVDLHNECLICPIMDHCVPFHIKCIKNFSISSLPGDGTYLRINFICPQSINSSRQVKQPALYEKHRDSHFVKELTYRNDNGENLQFCYQKLKELQKQFKTNKKNKMLNVQVTKQDRLQRAPANRVLTLKDLSVKPSLAGRKRGTGRIETHINGFKYVDHKRNEVYVLFNNIKNAFLQKSKNTTAVIIHFHLKNPILIGKKPSAHVQVYRDVIERFEELGRGRRRYDYDGMRAEQEEQKRIKKTNQQFKMFCDKSKQMALEHGFNLEFDKPNFDLTMNGVPNKQSTDMYPTENCLIALDDSPAFVIDMRDVEIAHFERVSYSLRNFDLVFVFKDFTQEPHRITTIPREYLDTLQDFLNWKNVLYSTGKINLDWKTLMGKIRTNLEGFINSGGWDFLLQQDDGYTNNHNRSSPNGDDDDDVAMKGPPSEDEYVPDDSDAYSDEDFSDDDDDDDYESDEYSDEDDDLNAAYEDDDDDEEGLDWDELDRRAALEDKKAAQREAETSRNTRMNTRNQQYRADNRMSNSNKRRRY
eukprot:CAMPEP_0197039880 /NCGR_PEP_ID=MMETSP1384-20130603/16638_1 /TAXON_ID=29189 /ORGANISM="Ammonia sp." /LENGTH=1132 /DNA_ID=CAMNT_0042470547 /DNA_START=51 /DNA_END=3449 /DNA_ORIENTATION=-